MISDLLDSLKKRVSVHTTLKSYHFDRSKLYNENNLGHGAGFKLYKHLSLELGKYYNSQFKDSYYIGLSCCVPIGYDIAMGGFIGIVTGYNKNVIFAIAPALTYKRGNTYARAAFIPKSKGILGFQIKQNFNY